MSAVCESAKAGDCPICLEPDPDMMVLCCGSAFHVACVAHWLQEPSAEPTCPTCREKLHPPPPVMAPEDSFWSEPSFTGPGLLIAGVTPGTADLEENQPTEISATRPLDEGEELQRAEVQRPQADLMPMDSGHFYVHGRRVLGEITNTVSSRPAAAASNFATARTAPPELLAVAQELRTGTQELRVAAPELRVPAPERRAAAPELRSFAPELRTAAPELRSFAPELRAAAPERREVVIRRSPGREGLNLNINIPQIGSPGPHSPPPRSPIFTTPQPNALRSGLSITPEPVPMQAAQQQHLRRGAGRGQGAASSARCSPASSSYAPCRPLR